MYQTYNPYTGLGTINLAPSEYSTLGLGVAFGPGQLAQ